MYRERSGFGTGPRKRTGTSTIPRDRNESGADLGDRTGSDTMHRGRSGTGTVPRTVATNIRVSGNSPAHLMCSGSHR